MGACLFSNVFSKHVCDILEEKKLVCNQPNGRTNISEVILIDAASGSHFSAGLSLTIVENMNKFHFKKKSRPQAFFEM